MSLSDPYSHDPVFSATTTNRLNGHTGEVWNIEWSHNGRYLASGSADRTAIIWNTEVKRCDFSTQDWKLHHVLGGHSSAVGPLAWSLDDSILLTTSLLDIKMWNVNDGVCQRTLSRHIDTVTALAWIPMGSGFLSGGLDSRIIHWDSTGQQLQTWEHQYRIVDFAVSPDATQLVVIGLDIDSSGHTSSLRPSSALVIYNLPKKQLESSVPLEGEPTSLTLTNDGSHALINLGPDGLYLWDVKTNERARKYSGHKQEKYIITSCIGGMSENLIISGSEDGLVYVWDRESTAILGTLSGHGQMSVNSVAWNPRNKRMFASCSDDGTIQIWDQADILDPEAWFLQQTASLPTGFNGNDNVSRDSLSSISVHRGLSSREDETGVSTSQQVEVGGIGIDWSSAVPPAEYRVQNDSTSNEKQSRLVNASRVESIEKLEMDTGNSKKQIPQINGNMEFAAPARQIYGVNNVIDHSDSGWLSPTAGEKQSASRLRRIFCCL
ncbi:WD40-repeat-containing domain protein [Crucibulum laeve]|uniref:WD40-repeat-containing domain protein n=1 Tax=Crucibulum laeve TaxID=68775 RepID=A0A5C3LZ53_9AGAR|nr:WD40-repeat-containing domain protein [Crucibulum laeve]